MSFPQGLDFPSVLFTAAPSVPETVLCNILLNTHLLTEVKRIFANPWVEMLFHTWISQEDGASQPKCLPELHPARQRASAGTKALTSRVGLTNVLSTVICSDDVFSQSEGFYSFDLPFSHSTNVYAPHLVLGVEDIALNAKKRCTCPQRETGDPVRWRLNLIFDLEQVSALLCVPNITGWL